MKKIFQPLRKKKPSGFILLFSVFVLLQNPGLSNAQDIQKEVLKPHKTQRGFIENKGQFIDQNNHPNPAVKYLLNMPGMNVQLKANSFSYDAYVVDPHKGSLTKNSVLTEDAFTFRFHRIDIEFSGANPSPEIIAEEASDEYLNYYTTGTAEEGALSVKHYGKVTYKNLYPGIDLVFQAQTAPTKPVEYSFIVHPGADLSLIRWKYNGSNGIHIKNGNIIINTIHGLITESIPLSWEKENGKKVDLSYKTNENGFFFI